jgi:radical SAM protein (TIGR01212 family)
VKRALDSAKPTDRFIAYFQNFTNTYAPIDILRAKYDSALTDERIVALAIGTRPDCITEEIADLIASYSERVDVWVELGLQSASERTAKIINRGYTTDVYLKACSVLHSRKIPTVTHIMIGLPGEGDDELCETVGVFNLSGSMGIKIHSVYVASGTELCRMYESGEYSPISMETYIERAVYVISHIRPDVIIHRLTGDCPRELLVAPMWNAEKNKVIEGIRNNLAEKNLTQGKYCIR